MQKKLAMIKTSKEAKPVRVAPNILDPNFKYTPSAGTNVQATWMKFGWKPVERSNEIKSST
jgi:hypothetical protein